MRVEKSVVINCPVENVFAFVTDFCKVPLWMPVRDLRPTSSGPIGIGSTYAQSAEFLGQRFEGTIQVTEYDPPQTFAFKIIHGPFPLANRMTFVRLADERTAMTLVGEAEPGNVLKLAGPFIVPLAKKQLETQISTLKRLLEESTV
jgi:uncharacterized protein YndB with AHSA1/START domain